MSKEKQIEEMAKIIADTNATLRCSAEVCRLCEFFEVDGELCKDCISAKALYNAGYRKQSEPISCAHEKGGEWISVEERLPEECKNVLCFARNKTMIAFMEKVEDCGEYVPVFWDWVAYDRDDTYDEVCATHWMPLPEAPKGGE